MGSQAPNVIQHDVGFPRLVREEMAEREALYAMLVSLGARKLMAGRLTQDYPQYRTAQAIVDCASDGEGDMRGAASQLEEDAPRRWRGGATLNTAGSYFLDALT